MKTVVASIIVDDEAKTTLVDFTDAFYKRPLPEQAAIVKSTLESIVDDFIGVHEEITDVAGGPMPGPVTA